MPEREKKKKKKKNNCIYNAYLETGMRSKSCCSRKMQRYMCEWSDLMVALCTCNSNSSNAPINDLKILTDANDK